MAVLAKNGRQTSSERSHAHNLKRTFITVDRR